MKLLYDLTATQPSPESRFHGGGAYGEVLFFKLLEYLDDFTLICYYDAKSYINLDILERIRLHKIKLYDINQKSVSQIISEEKIDRLYSAMLNLNQKIPLGELEIYTTVHGLRTLEMPFDPIMLEYASSLKEKIKYRLFMGPAKNYYLKKLKAINGRLVTDPRINVITISNHSLASIKTFYPETAQKEIPVFASPTFDQLDNYQAVTDSKKLLLDALHRENITEKKFFLVTSAARWAKNALRAVMAFDQLCDTTLVADFKLVVTGVTRKSIFTKHLQHPERFVFLGYVERDFLELLTEQAYAFIYPSLNEGFGYPPVDSMKYGVPVAASGTSSIPEVCGDAALYFDPYSLSEIKNRIVQLLNKDIYKEYAKSAKVRYQFVSKKQKDDLENLARYIIN
ncbi:glycosyltransferase [Treponema zioleckii]|uniref:glycosyltransferase n=1 Tax=Treponema zioleckii TaxID=331680 RepID=UPI00168A496E|nr:glycosyltransferase [Treponema zioleckii]